MPKVQLDTPQFLIIFHLSPCKFSNRVTVVITMTNKSIDYPYAFRSSEETVEKTHLRELCDFLNQHCEEIKVGNRPESYGYFDYDMLYKVTPYIGSYDVEKQLVYFSLTFLVNTGFSKDNHTVVWMGGYSAADSGMIRKFGEDMDAAIKATDASVYGA